MPCYKDQDYHDEKKDFLVYLQDLKDEAKNEIGKVRYYSSHSRMTDEEIELEDMYYEGQVDILEKVIDNFKSHFFYDAHHIEICLKSGDYTITKSQKLLHHNKIHCEKACCTCKDHVECYTKNPLDDTKCNTCKGRYICLWATNDFNVEK